MKPHCRPLVSPKFPRVPQEGSGAGVGVGVVRGGRDSLNWKMSKFQSVLASSYLRFLLSWLQGFLVSSYLRFFVTKFQRFKKFIECLLEDIDPILPSVHTMLFDRCWSHTQDFRTCQFHVFWKILIPYSRFAGNIKTDLEDFRAPVFSNISRNEYCIALRFLEMIAVWNELEVFLTDLKSFGVFTDRSYWSWESWTRPESRKPWKWWVFSFPKMKSKSY